MFSVFHAAGISFFADAMACGDSWLSTIDVVCDGCDVVRHQRLERYPTQTAALLASFADAYHLTVVARRGG